MNELSMKTIIQQLQKYFDEELLSLHKTYRKDILPDIQKTSQVVNLLQKIVFADYFNCNVKKELKKVKPLISKLLSQCLRDNKNTKEICEQFLEKIPEIRELLNLDIISTYDNDPACKSKFLPVLCYPGILAITYYRIAHVLHVLQIPFLPRIITELAHRQTGIDIHPGASIGKSFFIDHGTGIVIGETSEIGNNVKMYHGVTLGAKSFRIDKDGHPQKNIRRHPHIGNNVTIYSNAVLLGNIHIGDNSVIGANIWITGNIPENTKVLQTAPNGEFIKLLVS